MMKLLKISLLFFLVLSFGCTDKKCHCIVDDAVVAKNDSLLLDPGLVEFWNNIGEPLAQKQEFAQYRLIKIPSTPDEEGVLYRLLKNDKSIVLNVKLFKFIVVDNEMNSQTIQEDKYEISQTQWNEFNQLVYNNCFWSMYSPPEEKTQEDEFWILEGKILDKNICTNRDYHLIGRSNMETEKAFFEIVDKLKSFAVK